jgi:hypothetical protein
MRLVPHLAGNHLSAAMRLGIPATQYAPHIKEAIRSWLRCANVALLIFDNTKDMSILVQAQRCASLAVEHEKALRATGLGREVSDPKLCPVHAVKWLAEYGASVFGAGALGAMQVDAMGQVAPVGSKNNGGRPDEQVAKAEMAECLKSVNAKVRDVNAANERFDDLVDAVGGLPQPREQLAFGPLLSSIVEGKVL